MTEKNISPAVAFNFEVKFNGGNISGDGGFQEVSGLSAQLGVQDINSGGGSSSVLRLPKPASFQNLVLKRGIITSSSLRDWVRKAIFEFEFTPISVTVHLLDSKQNPILTWVANNAWPVKWDVGAFNSQENQVAVETFELAYDSLTVQN